MRIAAPFVRRHSGGAYQREPLRVFRAAPRNAMATITRYQTRAFSNNYAISDTRE